MQLLVSHSSTAEISRPKLFSPHGISIFLPLSLSDYDFSRCTVVCAASKVSFAKHLFLIQMKVFDSVDCRFPNARRCCQKHQVAKNHCPRVSSGFSSPVMFHHKLRLTCCRENGLNVLLCQHMLLRCSTTSQPLFIQCHSSQLPLLL